MSKKFDSGKFSSDLENTITKNEHTFEQVSILTGVSLTKVWNIVRCDRNPSVEQMYNLLIYMESDFDLFFV